MRRKRGRSSEHKSYPANKPIPRGVILQWRRYPNVNTINKRIHNRRARYWRRDDTRRQQEESSCDEGWLDGPDARAGVR